MGRGRSGRVDSAAALVPSAAEGRVGGGDGRGDAGDAHVLRAPDEVGPEGDVFLQPSLAADGAAMLVGAAVFAFLPFTIHQRKKVVRKKDLPVPAEA